MPRGVKKENLPTKICVVCERPFTWRKKWERCWDEVTTCSKACNSQRRRGGKSQGGAVDALQQQSSRPGSPATVTDDASDQDDGPGDLKKLAKAARKEAKKAKKAAKRLQREGNAPASTGQKPCTVCGKSSDLLVRCQIDQAGAWHLVCGKCWKQVSGGVVDGDEMHPYYRYGGLWKNRIVKVASKQEAELHHMSSEAAVIESGALESSLFV